MTRTQRQWVLIGSGVLGAATIAAIVYAVVALVTAAMHALDGFVHAITGGWSM